MARISGIDAERTEGGVAELFRKQKERWGSTLEPYRIYARRPSIALAVRGMWDGLKESGLLPIPTAALINRRVASLNGCLF